MTAPQPNANELVDVLRGSNGKLALKVNHDLTKPSYYVHDQYLKMMHSGKTARENAADPMDMLEMDVSSEHATIEVVHRSETGWAIDEETEA